MGSYHQSKGASSGTFHNNGSNARSVDGATNTKAAYAPSVGTMYKAAPHVQAGGNNNHTANTNVHRNQSDHRDASPGIDRHAAHSSNTPKACHICGSTAHLKRDCPKAQGKNGSPVPQNSPSNNNKKPSTPPPARKLNRTLLRAGSIERRCMLDVEFTPLPDPVVPDLRISS